MKTELYNVVWYARSGATVESSVVKGEDVAICNACEMLRRDEVVRAHVSRHTVNSEVLHTFMKG
jgi:hypothetical protein